MSRLTQKFPLLKKEITLKVWVWIVVSFVGNIIGGTLYDFVKWLLK